MSDAAVLDTSFPLLDMKAMADWTADLDKEDVDAILSQVPSQCAACLSEIEAALGASELPKVKRVAHRLKGMAANLGATRLSRHARTIEIEAQALDDVTLQLPALRTTMEETLAAIAACH